MRDEPDFSTLLLPLLDEAISSLGSKDRATIIGRYLEGQDLTTVATMLGTTVDGAQKRSERAVAKLRAFFARRGVTGVTSMGVVTVLTEANTPASSSVLAAVVFKPGVVLSSTSLSIANGVSHALMWAHLKLAALVVVLMAGSGLGVKQVGVLLAQVEAPRSPMLRTTTPDVSRAEDRQLEEWVRDWTARRKQAGDGTLQADVTELTRLTVASTWSVTRLQNLAQQVIDGQGTAANLGPFYTVLLDRAEQEISATVLQFHNDDDDDTGDAGLNLDSARERVVPTMRSLRWSFRPLWEDIKDPRLTQRLFKLQMDWDPDKTERLWRRFQYGDFFMLIDPPDFQRAYDVMFDASRRIKAEGVTLNEKRQKDVEVGLGYALYRLKRYDEALPYLKSLHSRNDRYHSPKARMVLIDLFLQQNRVLDARPYYGLMCNEGGLSQLPPDVVNRLADTFGDVP